MSSEVSDSNVIIWLSIIIGVLGILGRSFIASFRTWADEKRRIAVQKDDADIADLKRQVDNLVQWREVKDQRDREHSAWDREVYRRCVEAGIDIDAPPPLF